ncbi:MAG TPA: sensor histidine kinase [Nocardioides sp.]|nr:sensor histidine kinase [Nocardioides sp.]
MIRSTAGLRHPEGAWGWGAGAATLAVVVVPQLVVLMILPETRTAPTAARTAGLVLSVVVVTSGIHMYLHHRLTCSGSTGWLATGLIFVGGTGLTATGLWLTPTDGESGYTPLVAADLLVAVVLLLMIRVAERSGPPFDPAAAGLLLACGASAVMIALSAPGRTYVAPALAPWLAVLLAGLGGAIALGVHRLVTVPPWARDRLAIAIVVLFLGRALLVGVGAEGTVANLATVAGNTLGATLILGTSLATLRLAIQDDRAVITALQDQLAATAAHARADRERLHEVKGTIAGIASASRLIHHDSPLPGPSRELLEEMLERESARLQRLIDEDHRPGPLGVVEVDDVVRPLVVARQAQGQRITWQPSGLRAWARADELTEVINILLENTARHAPDAEVAVFARETDDQAQVVIADSGPGIPPGERTTIFHRGVRGSRSDGDGLGLHVARRLMLRSGGCLQLDESWQQGTAFVVSTRRAGHVSEVRPHDDHVVAQ